VVNVQRELTLVNERIESFKGRMQYLERSAKMSMLNINLNKMYPPPPPPEARPIFTFSLSRTLRMGLMAVGDLVSWLLTVLILGVMVGSPFAAVAAIVALVLRRRTSPASARAFDDS